MNECRDLGEDAVAWRRHWLAGLAGLVGADLAVGGELAGLRSGAPRDLGTADWGWENGFDRGGWLNALDLLRDAPSYSPLLASYAGWEDGAALRRSDLVGERAWRATAECQLVDRAIGADHAVYCFRAVAGVADESSGSFLLRGVGGGDFTPRDTSVVREGHAALGPLIRPDARRHRPTPSDERPPAGPACDANFRGKSGETRGKVEARWLKLFSNRNALGGAGALPHRPVGAGPRPRDDVGLVAAGRVGGGVGVADSNARGRGGGKLARAGIPEYRRRRRGPGRPGLRPVNTPRGSPRPAIARPGPPHRVA